MKSSLAKPGNTAIWESQGDWIAAGEDSEPAWNCRLSVYLTRIRRESCRPPKDCVGSWSRDFSKKVTSSYPSFAKIAKL